MRTLSSENLLEHIQNIIHEETQVHKNRIDLTVHTIHKLTSPGSLDFGGSEFQKAETEEIHAQKENPDDDYGWWNLKADSYKAVFNEQIALDEDLMAIMNLHTHARETGIMANTQIIGASGQLSMVFTVPDVGCNIKENARFAAIHLFQT